MDHFVGKSESNLGSSIIYHQRAALRLLYNGINSSSILILTFMIF